MSRHLGSLPSQISISLSRGLESPSVVAYLWVLISPTTPKGHWF